jgi:hypothetical protein
MPPARAQQLLGATIAKLGSERSSFILSTKLYWAIQRWPH